MKKQNNLSILLIVTFANIFGKLLGFLKDILLTYNYGISYKTDALFLAMSIPYLILGVFTSSTDSLVIPQYSRIQRLYGERAAQRNFSNIFNSIIIVASVVSLIIFLKPSIIIKAFALGFNSEQQEYGEIFLRRFSFLGVLHISYCYFSSLNSAYKRVIPRAILSFTTNLLVVLFLIFVPDEKMLFLSTSFILGSILSGVIPPMAAMFRGYRHHFVLFKFDNEFSKFLTMFVPIVGVSVLTGIHEFVDKFLASFLSIGSISYLNYAFRLTSIFDSILIVGIGIILLPLLSGNILDKKPQEFSRNYSFTIKTLLLLLTPIFVFSFLFSAEIIQLIYERGQFTAESTKIVSLVFLCYCPLILFQPLQAVLVRVFHSFENSITPLKINMIGVGINVILSVSLGKIYGIIGIALSTTIAFVISIALLLIELNKIYKIDTSVLNFAEISKLIIAITISSLIVYLIKCKIRIVGFNGLLLCSFIYLLVFLIVIYFLFESDLKFLYSVVKKK